MTPSFKNLYFTSSLKTLLQYLNTTKILCNPKELLYMTGEYVAMPQLYEASSLHAVADRHSLQHNSVRHG